MSIELIVIGASAGGLKAVSAILEKLPVHFPIPILIVLHVSAQSDDYWIRNLDKKCRINIKEAEDKEPIKSGVVYFAPPDYHILVDYDKTITLSIDEKVNYSRPAIDVLFETASDIYREKLSGVVLTGSSVDGAKGLRVIKENGGITIVQDPAEADYKYMPEEAIKVAAIDYILPLEKITELLISFNHKDH
jgi:two-component system chemotaxis response regulator CheB